MSGETPYETGRISDGGGSGGTLGYGSPESYAIHQLRARIEDLFTDLNARLERLEGDVAAILEGPRD